MRDRVLFVAGGREFTVDHVLTSAERRGDLAPVGQAVRDALACAAYADDEAFALEDSRIEQLAETYRIDRDLTTAEDTEAWLEVNGLTIDDFTLWLERRAWRDRFAESLEAIRADYEPGQDEIEDAVWPEIVFGNHLDTLARRLAVAVAAQMAGGGAKEQADWPSEVARMEVAYAERCREALTDESIARETTLRAAGLMSVELELVSFPTLDGAREAWLCATSDGEALPDVAARSGGAWRRAQQFLDQLPESLRQRVWSAAPGEILAPSAEGDRFVVCRVLEKRQPDPADPRVRARIEDVLVDRVSSELMQGRVQWASGAAPGSSV
jgi:hypothetical protein